MHREHWLRMAYAAVVLGMGAGISRAQDDTSSLADYYGFQKLEIYKLDSRISDLRSGDLDQDGIDDLVVANNGRSRIDLLLTGPGRNALDDPGTEVNDLRSDRRLRLATLPVYHEVVSLQVGDLDGDGHADLVYYGLPSELVVLRSLGGGEFESPRRIKVPEAIESSTALAVGDLNNDGRADLALLGDSELTLLMQGGAGAPGAPRRLAHALERPDQVAIVDLNGDARLDLALIDSEGERPLHVRFQDESGGLGPEERVRIEEPQALAYAELDGEPGSEIVLVEARSGRAQVLSLASKEAADGPSVAAERVRLREYPVTRSDARNRTLALADLDGDARLDVVVSNPDAASLELYVQEERGLGSSLVFPNLSGCRNLAAADLDGDGKAELFVLSVSEKQVAMTRYDGKALSYPRPLTIEGEPLALGVGDLDGDGVPEVLYVSGRAGSGRSDAPELHALRFQEGGFQPYGWGETSSVAVEGLATPAPAIEVGDVNGDGRSDILLFSEYGSPTLLIGAPEGPPRPLKEGVGPLAGLPAAAISTPPKGIAGLLLAQNTYGRHVALDAENRWEVRAQFNAEGSSAQASTVAALGAGEGGVLGPVVLIDRAGHKLLWLEATDGVYRQSDSLDLGSFDVRRVRVADLGPEPGDELLLEGGDRFAVLTTGVAGPRFETLTRYVPPDRETDIGVVAVGDVNDDKRPDVLFVDRGENRVEVAAYHAESPARLLRALQFPVFEAKSPRVRDRLVEPRELALGDYDGDGRTDFALITHDRVLVYRQDAGGDEPAAPMDSGEGP